jgi:hypothetical protein
MGGEKDLIISQRIKLRTGKGRDAGFAMICQGTPMAKKNNLPWKGEHNGERINLPKGGKEAVSEETL